MGNGCKNRFSFGGSAGLLLLTCFLFGAGCRSAPQTVSAGDGAPGRAAGFADYCLEDPQEAIPGLTAVTLQEAQRGKLTFMEKGPGSGRPFVGNPGALNAFRLGWTWMGTAGPPAAGVVDEEFLVTSGRSFVQALNSSSAREKFSADFSSLYKALKDRDVHLMSRLLTPERVGKGTEFFLQQLPGVHAVAFAQGRLYMREVLLFSQSGELGPMKQELEALLSAFSLLKHSGPLVDSVERVKRLFEQGKSSAAFDSMVKDMSML